DGGKNWSPRQLIAPAQALGIQNLFLPDGTQAIFYWRFVTGMWQQATHQIELRLSADGGTTFAPPIIVQPVPRAYVEPRASDAWFLPAAASDRQAGVLYLAYQALAGPATTRVPSIVFTRSRDRGQTWSVPVAVNDTTKGRSVYIPSLAVSPDGQHVTISF